MKKSLSLLGALIFLVSCVSVPTPEGPDDSLVIGYFSLDFPDGFFAQNRRTITNGITLNFVNQNNGHKFSVMTSQGYYQFLSNGTDTYSFTGYKVRADRATVQSSFDKKFDAKPHSVLYLGHLIITYAKPKQTNQVSMDMKTKYWNYDTSASLTYKEGEMLTYLKSKYPESPWLEYEVVR